MGGFIWGYESGSSRQLILRRQVSIVPNIIFGKTLVRRRLAMEKGKRLDFTGQTVFVGLDVHKRSWSVSVYTEHGEYKTFTQPPEPEKLVCFLRRHFPAASYRVVYEAGFFGFWIYEELAERGVECVVVNPADVPTKDKEQRVKRDGVDCRKLARCLRAGEIEGIYVPSRGRLEDRSLLRARLSMGCKLRRCKNQIKALLYFYGIGVPEELEGRCWSVRFIRWLEGVRMRSRAGQMALRVLIEEFRHLRSIIVSLDREIRQLARSEAYRESVRLLRTVPGIGTFFSMLLLTELCEIGRFPSIDELSSYVGLVPDVHASGEREYVVGVTKRRRAYLRWLLIEASWVAVRKDPVLMMAFKEYCRRMKKTRAIVKIARKLLNRIRYVLKNRSEYVAGVIE